MVHWQNSMMRVMMAMILRKIVLKMARKKTTEKHQKATETCRETPKGVQADSTELGGEPQRGQEEHSADITGFQTPRDAPRGGYKIKDRIKVQKRVGSGGKQVQKCAETGVLSTFWREENEDEDGPGRV